jgi:hypothetical protein
MTSPNPDYDTDVTNPTYSTHKIKLETVNGFSLGVIYAKFPSYLTIENINAVTYNKGIFVKLPYQITETPVFREVYHAVGESI